MNDGASKQINTLVIGGGQAGLATAYHLAQAGVSFQIVDANQRTGDSWRSRWDSLRLFTPNRFNSLPGFPIPGEDWGFPTKDELADYLESYAEHFDFPIRRGVRIDRLSRRDGRFVAETNNGTFVADNVVVAMAPYQEPKTPQFAAGLDSGIVQIHAHHYKNPGQLQVGDVLVVGLGNSGAEIAKELAGEHHVYLAGEPSAVQPFRPEKLSGRIMMPFVGPVILNGLLTTNTPMGRKVHAKMRHKAMPLMRVKPKDLVAAGVERVGRVTGAVDGSPELDDGSVLDVANVVWCTGYSSGFSWIDLPVFDEAGDVTHSRGVVDSVSGLYFVALKFQYSVLSDALIGVGRDAAYVVDHLTGRPTPSAAGTEADIPNRGAAS